LEGKGNEFIEYTFDLHLLRIRSRRPLSSSTNLAVLELLIHLLLVGSTLLLWQPTVGIGRSVGVLWQTNRMLTFASFRLINVLKNKRCKDLKNKDNQPFSSHPVSLCIPPKAIHFAASNSSTDMFRVFDVCFAGLNDISLSN
jgi:hypothetical protein